MISQERIDEIAADAVAAAIRDLAGDPMGLAERLSNEDGYDDLSGKKQDLLCEDLEAAIRKHLPPDQQ